MKTSGGSQPRNEEGALRLARCGMNAEAFLINSTPARIQSTDLRYNVNR